MSEFWKRALSGAVYVAAVVGCILWHPLAFGILFFVVCVWAVSEYHHLMGSSAVARGGSIVCAAMLWFAAMWRICAPDGLRHSWGIYALIGAMYVLVLAVTLIEELWSLSEHPVNNWGNVLISQTMIAVPFCALCGLMALDKWLLLALFVLMWVNDSGAYCVGVSTAKRAEGNHKMFPRVSPKKSWEGLFGGMAFTIGAAFVLHRFGWFDSIAANSFGEVIIILFALLASGAGTLGDLMESLMKRSIGVKDSGKFLPGHGGVLDRFDSILLAAPILLVYSWLCYVASSLL